MTEGNSTVTGETAQGVRQIAQTSEDLNRLAENLQRLLERFKLEGVETSPASAEHRAKAPSSHASPPADPLQSSLRENVVNTN